MSGISSAEISPAQIRDDWPIPRSRIEGVLSGFTGEGLLGERPLEELLGWGDGTLGCRAPCPLEVKAEVGAHVK